MEGTLLLMDTSGILDGVLGALSMGFVLSIDKMLCLGPPGPRGPRRGIFVDFPWGLHHENGGTYRRHIGNMGDSVSKENERYG